MDSKKLVISKDALNLNNEIYDSEWERIVLLVATFFATCLQFCVPRVNRN